jgi:PAS domain S-box-containing protein
VGLLVLRHPAVAALYISVLSGLALVTLWRFSRQPRQQGLPSALQEAEAALRSSEERFRNIFSTAPSGIAMTDERGHYTTANPSFCEMLGYTEVELLTRRYTEITHPDDLTKGLQLDSDLLEGRRSRYGVEKRYIRRNGEVLHSFVSVTLTSDPATGERRFVGQMVDITPLKKAEAALIESRNRYLEVLNHVKDIVFQLDISCRWTLLNPAWEEVTGYPADEVLGRNALDFVYKRDQGRCATAFGNILQEHTEFAGQQLRILTQSGNLRWLEIDARPMFDADGQIIAISGTLRDITERKNTEDALRESELRLKTIFNASVQWFMLVDLESRLVTFNRQAAEDTQALLGRELQLGASVLQYVPDENKAEFTERLQRALAGETGGREFSFSRHQRLYWIDYRFVPIRDEAGDVTSVCISALDVTDEKEAMLAIEGSELRFRTLVQNSSDMTSILGTDGTIKFVSPSIRRVLGFRPEESLFRSAGDFVHPDDLPAVEEAFLNVRPGNDRIIEYRHRNAAGEWVWLESVISNLTGNPAVQGIVTNSRNISERKRFEADLVRSERHFRALIENSSDVILILDERFRIRFVSASLRRILGGEPVEAIDRSVTAFVHPADRSRVEEVLNALVGVSGESRRLSEFRLLGANRQPVYFEATAVNLIGDGVVNGIIVNCHNINDRKNTENELLTANFELDSFVYRTSHDLRAPLRSVLGLINLARMENPAPSGEMYLGLMEKSVQKLDSFIDDLTQFSKNSRLDVRPEPIDFQKLINEALDNMRFADQVRGVDVQVQVEEIANFHSDITRLSIVLNNLVSNAFKYRKFDVEGAYIRIGVTHHVNGCCLEVTDNGIGIAPEQLPRIYDMFYRASEQSYGSGLGLYIVQHAVTKLKGNIAVSSVPDQGTRFTVTLPNLYNPSGNGKKY